MAIKFVQGMSLQSTSALKAVSYQSLMLSLLRGGAALQVAAAHLRAEIYPGLRGVADAPFSYQVLAFATGFAHQAVVVFFLISGWLVGGSLLDKWSHPKILRSYAIDRVSRLWTVILPTLLLMLACAGLIDKIDLKSSQIDRSNEFSGVTIIGNLFGMQTIAVDNFGQNYALWSLANETWYYCLFPLVMLTWSGRSLWQQMGAAIAIAIIVSFLPLSILLYFSVWVLGAVFSRMRIDCGNRIRFSLLFIFSIQSVYFRLTGKNADLAITSYWQDLAYSIPLLTLLATLHAPSIGTSMTHQFMRLYAQRLSNISFTLYVTHVPIIAALRYVGQEYLGRTQLVPEIASDQAIYFLAMGVIVVFAFLIYQVFECNTDRVRRLMKKWLM